MNDSPKIYGALAELRKQMKAVGRNAQAPQQMGGFSYRSIEDVVEMLDPLLRDLGIIGPVLETLEHHVDFFEVATQKGASTRSRALVRNRYTLYATDGSSISGVSCGEAHDMGDKATNKANTAAFKYWLTQTLFIASEMHDQESDGEVVEGTARVIPKEAPAPPPPIVPVPMEAEADLLSATNLEELKERFDFWRDDAKRQGWAAALVNLKDKVKAKLLPTGFTTAK